MPAESSANRWSRPSDTSASSWVWRRAAASSMASGRPSRRRTSSATSDRLASSSSNPGTTARARAANSSTPDPSLSSVGTAQTCSPGTRSRSWLVASTTVPGQPAVTCSTSAATGSSTCSQLSSTRTSSVVPTTSTMRSAVGMPGRASMRRLEATTSTAVAASAPASSQSTTGRSPRGGEVVADLDGQAGLAHPAGTDERDGAVLVDEPTTWASSASRPTNAVAGTGSRVDARHPPRSAPVSSSACWAASAGDGSMPSSSARRRRRSS